MKYYHVRLYTTQNPQSWEWVPDLSCEQLERRVLARYRAGKPITLKGKSTSADYLERITIDATDGPWETAHSTRRDVTDEFIAGPPRTQAISEALQERDPRPCPDTRRVFVVHGRNDKAREAMFIFLRSIHLDPVEWSEAVTESGSSTPYIGEILDAAFSRAHAVVVLFTPDDLAYLRKQFRAHDDPRSELEPTGQARPNVLFEAGMAMGRYPKRTVLVELGNLRRFSDIDGLHLVRMDNTAQRRNQLARRLQSAGCPVRLTGDDWYTAGDFDSALESGNGSYREDASIQSGLYRSAHRDSRAVGESIHEREDQAFINAVTDFDDA